MNNILYNYNKPQNTYTIDQFIQCQSDTNVCYNNLSFIDQRNSSNYNTYNLLSDYSVEFR